jgi:hypothetical protein
MAKKTQSKKASSSKAKNSNKTSKKASTKEAVKKSSTSQTSSVATDYKDLFYGTISLVAVYVFALWAIDSGSLWVYGFTFTALYYVVHFFRLFIRSKFLNNDKTRKAR